MTQTLTITTTTKSQAVLGQEGQEASGQCPIAKTNTPGQGTITDRKIQMQIQIQLQMQMQVCVYTPGQGTITDSHQTQI